MSTPRAEFVEQVFDKLVFIAKTNCKENVILVPTTTSENSKTQPRTSTVCPLSKETCIQDCDNFCAFLYPTIQSANGFCWIYLFQDYIVISQTITEHELVIKWIDAFSLYIQCAQKNKTKYKHEHVAIAHSLVTYLYEHYVDPDNAVVGCTVRSHILSTYYIYSNEQNMYKLHAGTQPIHPNAFITIPTLDSAPAVKKRKKSSHFEFERGDLAIWFKKGKTGNLVRVMEVLPEEERFISITSDPREDSCHYVFRSMLVPLHPELFVMMQTLRNMRRVISDPFDSFFKEVSNRIKKKVGKFLESQGVDQYLLGLFEKTDCNSITLLDLPKIIRMNALFVEWGKNPPTTFLNSLKAFGLQELCKFEENLPDNIFRVGKETTVNELREFDYASLASVRFDRFVGNAQRVLGHLQLEKKLIMNGTRKTQLTTWWLRFIDVECDKFLSPFGFQSSVIPRDYTSEVPKDLAAIRKNVEVIGCVLNKQDEHFSPLVRKFVEETTNTIYKKINSFLKEALIVLSEYFGLDFDLASWDAVREQFLAKKDSIFVEDPTVVKWIDDMLKDIEYLLEMQEMEKIKNEDTKLVLSKVVPVSGLVFSYFHRQENVLKTILELYGKTTPAPTSPPTTHHLVATPSAPSAVTVSTLAIPDSAKRKISKSSSDIDCSTFSSNMKLSPSNTISSANTTTITSNVTDNKPPNSDNTINTETLSLRNESWKLTERLKQSRANTSGVLLSSSHRRPTSSSVSDNNGTTNTETLHTTSPPPKPKSKAKSISYHQGRNLSRTLSEYF